MPSIQELKSIFSGVGQKVGLTPEQIDTLFDPEAPLPEFATTTRDNMAGLMSQQVALQNKTVRDTIRKEAYEEAEGNLFAAAKQLAPNVFTEDRIQQINAQKKYSNKGAAIFQELHKMKTDKSVREKQLEKEVGEWRTKAEKGEEGFKGRIETLEGEVKSWQEKAGDFEKQLETKTTEFKVKSEDDRILAIARRNMRTFDKGMEWMQSNTEAEIVSRIRSGSVLVENENTKALIPMSKANPTLNVYGTDELTPLDLEGFVKFHMAKMGVLSVGKGGRIEDDDEGAGGGGGGSRNYRREGDRNDDDKNLTPQQKRAKEANRAAMKRAQGQS